MINIKNKAVWIFYFLIIAAVSVWLVLNTKKQTSREIQPTPSASSELKIDRILGESGWEETKTYTNTAYGYSLEYPGRYLDVLPEEPSEPGVAFIMWNDLGRTMEGKISYLSFGSIHVGVSESKFLSPEEFKKTMEISHTFIETRKIAGEDAFVYSINSSSPRYSDCPDNRFAFFVRDGLRYIIETCTINHKRIWNSFRFEK